ncbi:hypothetical protein HDV63DRAFT_351335 [Trichoderma sp. SZMC 28014]
MSPTGSNADPREAKKPQIGWLFSVVLVRVSAGHQPNRPPQPLLFTRTSQPPTCPLHRAEPWWPSTNKNVLASVMPPGTPVGSHHYFCSGKKASARDDWAAPSVAPKKQKRRDWEAAAQVWKAFCWMIGLVQGEQMRMLWILRTPAGKMVQQGSSVLPFSPHWPRS